MRVAYICADPGIPVFGRKGASRHVREIVLALLRRGAHVELFSPRLEGDVAPGMEDVGLHPLPSLGKGDAAARELAALAANKELQAALERAGPFDLVYERYSLWSSAGMVHAQAQSIPGLIEVNAPLIEEQARYRSLVHRAKAEQVAAQVFGTATALLAVSEGVAAYLRRFPIDPDQIHVVPNGVDPDRFRPGLPPAWPGEPDTFTVGFVGTLKPWHGLGILIEAFANLHRDVPWARLLIVGDGPMREQIVADLGTSELLDATHLAGSIPPDEVPHWLTSLQVGVAPYPHLEGFYFSPLKVFEYMAAGLPVVASRVGQLNGVIRDGVNGILCPPGDAAALAKALRRLQADPGLRRRMGHAARESVLRHHTWDAVVTRSLQLAGIESLPPADQRGRP